MPADASVACSVDGGTAGAAEEMTLYDMMATYVVEIRSELYLDACAWLVGWTADATLRALRCSVDGDACTFAVV